MIDCKECIHGFVNCCPVGYSKGNAACLIMQRRWKDEPFDKVRRALDNVYNYESEKLKNWYNNRLEQLKNG